jgi:hypothetical protein
MHDCGLRIAGSDDYTMVTQIFEFPRYSSKSFHWYLIQLKSIFTGITSFTIFAFLSRLYPIDEPLHINPKARPTAPASQVPATMGWACAAAPVDSVGAALSVGEGSASTFWIATPATPVEFEHSSSLSRAAVALKTISAHCVILELAGPDKQKLCGGRGDATYVVE